MVGVTDYLQDTAGDFLYVQLPEAGKALGAGDPVCSLEAGKWVGQLLAPFAGTVVEVNDALRARPGLVNDAPYGEGWLVRLAPATDAAPAPASLMDAASYAAWLDELAMEDVAP